ncbi:3-hydroxyacyl-CoA dehydrogenase [Roseobacter denitrificans]|nr:3-hydroxyacyl-CoA dehydrogenase [Roseobacter denitrificans]
MGKETGCLSKPPRSVAIIGCGLIGQAWATVFLRAGMRVTLYDAASGLVEQAKAQVIERMTEFARFDLVTHETLERAPAHIELADTLEDAVSAADYIQESGSEALDVKIELTREIDRFAAPHVVIGSSTSGITASRYSETIKGRERCLVVHPINPPHLVPLVEVVPAPWTAQSAVDTVHDLLSAIGQVPILLNREIDGFVVNRLQGALLREAFHLLDQGVASRKDIDKAISDGLGLRWSLMGPFETIHLNAPGGVSDYVRRFGPMYRDMFADDPDPVDWETVVDAGLEADLTASQPLSGISAAQKTRDSALLRMLAQRSRKANAASKD